MKTNLILAGIMFIMIGFTACKTKEERAPVIPMEDFFKDPEKAGFRISPNGQMIIFRAPHMGTNECLCTETW